MKDAPNVISTLREACNAPDATALRQAVKEAIQKLTIEYFDLPLEINIIAVMHFLSETQSSEFADRRRTMKTLILEAMVTPDWELPAMYKVACEQGKPPRQYQNAMVAAHCNIWHSDGVNHLGPLSSDPTKHWVDLKDMVMDVICRQAVQKVKFAKALDLGAGTVPPGTYCQTSLCRLVKRPRSRGLLD